MFQAAMENTHKGFRAVRLRTADKGPRMSIVSPLNLQTALRLKMDAYYFHFKIKLIKPWRLREIQ